MKTALVRAFIESRRQPLSASVETAARLELLCQAAPEFCVTALGDVRTHVSQKAHLLAGLVRSAVERRQIVEQLNRLSDDDLLHVLDGLRLRRLNGRRVRELGLTALAGHSRLAELAAGHRLRAVRIVKHLLGERTWSSVRRFLAVPSPEGDRFLQTRLLRFAQDVDLAREAFCFLAGLGFDQPEPSRSTWLVVPWRKKSGPEQFRFDSQALQRSAAARHDLAAGRGMPRELLTGLRGTYHRDVPARNVRELAAPVTRRLRADGPVTSALKAALQNSGLTSLETAVAYGSGPQMPVVKVKAAVVLDLSGSAASSGERLYHPAALGLALVGLLERLVSELDVFQTGGSVQLNGRGIPRPAGSTDLATAVLQAARTAPEAILIVTDGYENHRQGDVAQVVAGMRRLGLTTLVEQVTPVIAAAEDLSRRHLSEEVPVVRVEHETGVGELAARLLLASQPEELDGNVLPAVERLLFA